MNRVYYALDSCFPVLLSMLNMLVLCIYLALLQVLLL